MPMCSQLRDIRDLTKDVSKLVISASCRRMHAGYTEKDRVGPKNKYKCIILFWVIAIPCVYGS